MTNPPTALTKTPKSVTPPFVPVHQVNYLSIEQKNIINLI